MSAEDEWVDVSDQPRGAKTDPAQTAVLFSARYPYLLTTRRTVVSTELRSHPGLGTGHKDPLRLFSRVVAFLAAAPTNLQAVGPLSKFHFDPSSVRYLQDGTAWVFCAIGGSTVHRPVWLLVGAHSPGSTPGAFTKLFSALCFIDDPAPRETYFAVRVPDMEGGGALEP